jgi:hypothetical protein
LRASDACSLPIEAVVGWPCLRFYNSTVRADQLLLAIVATAGTHFEGLRQPGSTC